MLEGRTGIAKTPAKFSYNQNQTERRQLQPKKIMKRLIALATITTLFALTALADDLAKLEGKWSVKKTRDGASYTQTIEIKKDTFKFKVIRGTDEVAIYAEGKLKLEKSGPFNVIKFVDIKGGTSESDISPIDDDHVSIYVLGENTWTVAANFDKDRDDQKPSLDAYVKATK